MSRTVSRRAGVRASSSLAAAGLGATLLVGLPGPAAAIAGPAWVAQESGTTENLNAVQFVAGVPGDVWAAGDNGTLLHTADGATWTAVDVGPAGAGVDFYGLQVLNFCGSSFDQDCVWVGGTNGTILLGQPDGAGGYSFCAQQTGITDTITSLADLGPNDIFAATVTGNQLRSGGGSNALQCGTSGYYEATAVTAGPLDGASTAADGATYVGAGGSMYSHTYTPTDGFVADDSGTTHDLHGIAGTFSGTLVAVGDAGTIVSTDTSSSGAPWTFSAVAPAPTSAALHAVSAPPVSGSTTFAAVGASGTILRSSDSGATWASEPSPTGTPDLYGVSMASDTEAWAAGADGTILHYTSQALAGAATGAASNLTRTAADVAGTITPAGATGYRFDYGPTAAYGSSTPVTAVPTGGAVSRTLSGLAAATTYHYRLVALNAAGVTYGKDATFTTQALAVPGAPVIGTATAGDRSATVRWTPPADDGGAVITRYTITPNDGTTDLAPVDAAAGATSVPVPGLTNGTTYTFTVLATNAVGDGPASASSNEVTPQAMVLPPPSPGLPPGGTASSDPSGNGPTADSPVVVAVTTPTGGQVDIVGGQTPVNEGGFSVVGKGFTINAPAASGSDPLMLTFTVLAADVPAGMPVMVLRDGAPVSACTTADQATPDPCVIDYQVLDNGDVQVTVLSSHASDWQVDAVGPGSLVPACGGDTGAPFTDLSGDVHSDAVACVYAYGIARGVDPQTYGPSAAVTREQMAEFLARLLDASGVTLPAAPPAPFDDLPADDVHRLAVNQLAALGVTRGLDASTFDPAGTVRRDQMASFLVRVLELASGRALPAGDVSFTDVGGDNHLDDIDKVAGVGVTAGVDSTHFDPSGAVRRDQMASFLARALSLLVAEGATPKT